MAGKNERRPARSGKEGGFGATSFFFLAALLVAPVLAVLRSDPFGQPIWAFAAGVVLSAVTMIFQGIDKRRAEADAWRVPENILHLLELLGGWPGSFVAQRMFRHKTAKFSYQTLFWLIVSAHEFVAVDFLLGWKMAAYLKRLAGF